MNTLTNINAKVLLVEDDAMNQFIAKKFLMKWGYNVVVANNGIEAVELIQSKQFNVVLMDMHMPEMDGVEAARIIRLMDDHYFKTLPIIAFSAVVETREKAIELGMNDFATKPIDPDDLQGKIIRYIQESDIKSTARALHIDFDIYTDGDDEFKQELGGLMITNLYDLQASFDRALNAQNIDILHLVLHKVKPTLSMLNDPEMNVLAEVLKTIDLKDPQFMVVKSEMQSLVDGMIRAIETELNLEPVPVMSARAA